MRLSLVTVHARYADGTISGSWIQDHVGTLDSAEAAARRTEAANGGRIEVAVVHEISPRRQAPATEVAPRTA